MNFAIIDTATAAVLGREGDRDSLPEPPDGLAYVEITDDQYRTPNELTATESGGAWTVSIAPPNNVWLHVAVSGGDGNDPPGILNNGSDALTITATLRATADPASPKIEVDGAWRITIRDDAGASYDMVKVQMTAGVVNASYTTTFRPAECELRESDFDPVTAGDKTYVVRLAAPARWKVYRNL